ncbi:hypothetical protein [Burkholderia multivorans]|uniref:hypothetical protein n=1 Tax=Burkholderia multivorans TaxID=87883 RepID=UPI001591F00B|nr:hypothetical protein [Burkholderia multivorans]
MATQNDFLPFATGPGANVVDQATYASLPALTTGFLSGTAQSIQLNKVWRQSSIMAAVVAQFIVNQTGQNATDDGTTATLLTNLASAVAVSARQNPVLADTGTANTYAVANLAAFPAYPTVSGLVINVSIANANTGASTLNVDGLGSKPIYGLALQPLQGSELIANGVACFLYVVAPTVNSGNGAWILMECAGGAQQVAPATRSHHAAQLGQVLGKQAQFSSSGSFTVPDGVTTIYVTGVGGGGGGGGGGGNSSTGAAGGGGGGGQGQQVIKSPITVAPGQILTVTIGSGGASGTAGSNSGSSGGNGGVGGVSSITGSSPTVSLILGGGQGGSGGIGNTGSGITSSGQGGLSGDGVTGSGSGGYPPAISGGVLPGMGGAGGASIFGAGGSCRVPTSGGGGVPAMGWGAGGSGGTGGSGSAASGGAGGQGKSGAFVLEW